MDLQMSCCICKKSLDNGEPTAILTEKGKDTINRFSEMYAGGKVEVNLFVVFPQVLLRKQMSTLTSRKKLDK